MSIVTRETVSTRCAQRLLTSVQMNTNAPESNTTKQRRSGLGAISNRAWLLYALMCAVFGTTFLAIKIGSNAGLPPFLAAGIRFTVAGAILICIRLPLRLASSPIKPTLQPSLVYLGRVAILGFLIIGATFGLTYSAAIYIDSGRIAQLQAIGPVMVTALSVLLLGTVLSVASVVGLLLGVLGAVLLVSVSGGSANPGAIVGALLTVGAEATYALGSIWYRKRFDRGTDPVLANGYSMLAGGLFLLGIAVATGQTQVIWTRESVASLLYLIVVGSIVAHTIYLWLVAHVSPVFAATWLFVSPVIATVLGALVLDEVVTIGNVVGMTAVLAGVYFVQRSERSGESNGDVTMRAADAVERDIAGSNSMLEETDLS